MASLDGVKNSYLQYNKAWTGATLVGVLAQGASRFLGDVLWHADWYPRVGLFIEKYFQINQPVFEVGVSTAIIAFAVAKIPNIQRSIFGDNQPPQQP